ncbi:hypothetical protein OEA41_006846 [Lepraria neglecta]|uniref:DUF3533 domain-containing protein n=1 Tax=Lepraria neglecta TaxID=209136 RepID=A0AAE0DKY8_9LECA|nr:hypothetical protein OEA41_006846 [Lepraria neglecta]
MEKQQVKTETAEESSLYNHSFFDEGFRSSRKLLLSVLLLPLVFTSLSMWACLSLYFVSPNASSALDDALDTGFASYDPLSTITLFFASGRNQITANSKVVPAILAVINPILTKASIQHTAAFLGPNTGNITALATAERCPQCLASPFAIRQIDLRPFDVAPATGTTMVGMIFLLTFAFSIFQILRTTGVIVGSKLNLRSALLFRTTTALLAYFFISLWYTLINLAFGVPMGRFLGKGGFVVFWMLNWCTMGAGIIVNVSGAFTSFELMPGFYRYGYGFPFYNSIQGARTIIFGTKGHLGVNFGVLIAWMAVGLIGMLAFTARTMKGNERKRVHALP